MKGQQLYLTVLQDPLLEGSFIICDVNGVVAKIKKQQTQYVVWIYKTYRQIKTDKLIKALTYIEKFYYRKQYEIYRRNTKAGY